MIRTNTDLNEIEIEDLGVTLRTLLGCALSGYRVSHKRRWSIRYKNAIIGSVSLKDTHLKPEL